MTTNGTLRPHPDRLFPPDPGVRAIARRVYAAVADLPILSPHGHVDPRLLLADQPFADPSTLLISPDHYVTRLLHAGGVSLSELGVGAGPLTEAQSRKAWRSLCTHWSMFRGTPVRYWFESELAGIFGIDERPGAHNADDLYDRIASCLRREEFRPRALFRRFNIEVLATTDDPADDLSVHAALRADPTWTDRIIPTFRPDRYLEQGAPGWADDIGRLAVAADIDTATYAGYLAALEQRRRHFIALGATSTDHSHLDVRTDPLPAPEADRIYRSALLGRASAAEATAFRRNMLFEMARMSVEDGLVMTLHPAIHRNHHPATTRTFGADTGHDIPVRAEFTQALAPLLERFGTHPNFQLVIFTADETVFSREIAPLAGFYPSVYAGAPWWFLDAPDAIRRYRGAVTETAGFQPHVGLRRRHPGLLFDPRPPRHGPSPRRGFPGPVGRRAPTRRGRGCRHRACPRAGQSAPGIQAVSSGRALSRALDGRPAAPVGAVHLGLGNFFRAHQAMYTDRAPDSAEWGIAAFTGRSAGLAATLSAQDGLYTLDSRSAEGDRFDIISSVSATFPGDDQARWLEHLSAPGVRLVTTTITESGYHSLPGGGLDLDHPGIQADLQALRGGDDRLRTAPGRLVAGLRARRRADAGPLTIVPCDNLPENGAVIARVLVELSAAVDPSLADWVTQSIGFASTVVDRITPRTTDADIDLVRTATGIADPAVVVTEPFTEWILSDSFIAGRPAWEEAGARFAADIVPFEHRKLWLLNGAHSLLAYAGSLRGHPTVADAVADTICRGWVHDWWDEAAPHLHLPAAEIAAYEAALTDRFENPRIRHQLTQIAADGSAKLPVRILAVIRAERAAGRLPVAAARVVAAWIGHLRGAGGPVSDPRAADLRLLVAGADRSAARGILEFLDPPLGADETLIAVVAHLIAELDSVRRGSA